MNAQSREAWKRNAAHWDETMGEGNRWNLQLIRPAVERLLGAVDGRHILDAGCGNGQISRWLADKGAQVVAFDFSEPLLARARARSGAYGGRVDYHLADATDRAALLALPGAPFDAVVATMALMDMADIEPLIEASRAILGPEGRFVFSVPHPCFNTSYTTLVVERSESDDGKPRVDYSVKTSRYKTPSTSLGIALLGQPAPQPYFNRPMEALFGAFFEAGFVLDGLLEPTFEHSGPEYRAHWSNFHEIPPVLVARMRPAAPP
jgi:2-polyprenyl-3-methyl-5-hydroxy-6-metoxy-1,4-benzoquinol methylase